MRRPRLHHCRAAPRSRRRISRARDEEFLRAAMPLERVWRGSEWSFIYPERGTAHRLHSHGRQAAAAAIAG
jgi:hypothetical protein